MSLDENWSLGGIMVKAMKGVANVDKLHVLGMLKFSPNR